MACNDFRLIGHNAVNVRESTSRDHVEQVNSGRVFKVIAVNGLLVPRDGPQNWGMDLGSSDLERLAEHWKKRSSSGVRYREAIPNSNRHADVHLLSYWSTG